MICRSALPVLIILALASCSSSYEILAKVSDGKITFVPAKHDIWGDPECVRTIIVTARDGPPAQAAPGDDAADVARGVYWESYFGSSSCENRFPLIYGAPLRGKPPVLELRDAHVSAKPLRAGVVYDVEAESPGSAYGTGAFMITPKGTITNLGRH